MRALEQEKITPFYEFGPFLVDTVKCVLIRDKEVVPLSLKAFEILLVLIHHRGQVLEKNDLLKRVWPDTLVEENNLARNISMLRKALDEQPNDHRYILTIPGQGYRFVANVRELEADCVEFKGTALDELKGSTAGAEHVTNGSHITTPDAVSQPAVIREIIR